MSKLVIFKRLAVLFLVIKLALARPADLYIDENDMNNEEVKQVTFLNRIEPSLNSIGQVGGLDTSFDGDLVVFHRGSRKWTYDSFSNDVFNKQKYGPIAEDVLALMDTKTSKVKSSWGANKFYMPHGLTIDSESNIWLSDVGMHQVFKYNFKESKSPLLTIGTAFEKGDDQTHLCKPTSIAVCQLNGNIFIADGYCNKRVAQFDKNGKFIKEFKDYDQDMIVVHSVTLIEEKNLVCAASREDGRIVCFDIDSAEKKHVITNTNMKTVYAIEYDPFDQVIHAVTGSNGYMPSYGLTFGTGSDDFGKFLQKWESDKDISDAHDIAVSPDSKTIYVGQLNGEIDTFSYE
jgi:DNA-binding beta-propeller fold protein YncE